MIAHTALRSHLLADSTVSGLVSGRVFAGVDEPPKTYDLSVGACVVFKRRDDDFTYDDDHATPSFQFKCYGRTELEALQVYDSVKQAIHHQSSQWIKYGELEGGGSGLREPSTDWPYVLAFFGVIVRV